MQIRFLSSIAGVNFRYKKGDETNYPDGEAKRLIAAGIAEPMDAETAILQAPETAAIRRRRRKVAVQ